MSLYYVRNNDTERLILSDSESISLKEIKEYDCLAVDLSTYLAVTDDLWNRNFIDEAIANRFSYDEIHRSIAYYFHVENNIRKYPVHNQKILQTYFTAIIDTIMATQALPDDLIQKEVDTVFSIGAFLDSCCPSHIDAERWDIPDDVREQLEEIKNAELKLKCSNEVLYTFLELIGKEPVPCKVVVDLPVKQRYKFDSANEAYQTVSENLITPSNMYYCYKIENISDLLVVSLLEIFKSGYKLKKCGCCDQYFVPIERGKQKYCHNEAKRYFYLFDGINEKKEYYYCDEWMKKISERKGSTPSVSERKEIKKLSDKLRKRFMMRDGSSNVAKVTYSYDDFIEEAGAERDKVRNGESSWSDYIWWLTKKDIETKDKW